ncbi:MAG: hypothetical protein ACQESC_00400 [Nanobdellota archaeon]
MKQVEEKFRNLAIKLWITIPQIVEGTIITPSSVDKFNKKYLDKQSEIIALDSELVSKYKTIIDIADKKRGISSSDYNNNAFALNHLARSLVTTTRHLLRDLFEDRRNEHASKEQFETFKKYAGTGKFLETNVTGDYLFRGILFYNEYNSKNLLERTTIFNQNHQAKLFVDQVSWNEMIREAQRKVDTFSDEKKSVSFDISRTEYESEHKKLENLCSNGCLVEFYENSPYLKFDLSTKQLANHLGTPKNMSSIENFNLYTIINENRADKYVDIFSTQALKSPFLGKKVSDLNKEPSYINPLLEPGMTIDIVSSYLFRS